VEEKMAGPKDLEAAETNLRELALRYPEAYEEFPWGHRAIKVKKKAFLFMGGDKRALSLSLKLPLSGRVALIHGFASPTGYGLGKSGWVTARFQANDDVPLALLKQWIDESYRAIAPAKLVDRLDAGESIDHSAKKPRRSKKREK
jgi:predicted DNA-binding protein (MmcQ/YjbR family)